MRSFFTGIKVVLGGVDAPTLPARPALGPAALLMRPHRLSLELPTGERQLCLRCRSPPR